MKGTDLDRRVVRYLLLAAALVLGVIYFDKIMAAAGRLWHIAAPLATGFVYAYILNMLIRRIDRVYFPNSTKPLVQKTRRVACILLAVLAIIAAIALIIYIVLPQLITAVSELVSAVPEALEMAGDWLEENQQYVPELAQRLNLDLDTLAEELKELLIPAGKGVVNSLLGVITGVSSGVVNFVISLVIALYLLGGKDKLLGQLDRVQRAFIKPSLAAKAKRVLEVADESFSAFIGGQFTEAMILGSLCTVGMWIFGFPFATTIGVFIGVTALVPIFGAYIGGAVGVVLIITVNPLQALLFVVYLVILQQLEGNLIYPRVVGTSLGLPGLWVMVAVTIGGGLAGITGMLLGVPIMATLYKLVKIATRERLKGEGEINPPTHPPDI